MQEVSKTPKIVGAFVISGVLLVGAYIVLAQNASESEVASEITVSARSSGDSNVSVSLETEQTQTTEPEPEEEIVAENDYKNGNYRAETTYRVPGGSTDRLAVSMSIEDDTITDFIFTTVASNPQSEGYQAGFDNRITGEITGQDLDEADVFRLGGASLTSAAFNDLLEAIRNEARS